MANLEKIEFLLKELKDELKKAHYSKDDKENKIINNLRKSLGMQAPQEETGWNQKWHNQNWANSSKWQQKPPKNVPPQEQQILSKLPGLVNQHLFKNQQASQPTDQQLFGSLVKSQEEIDQQEAGWGNTFNNWLVEATRPISERFGSPEEEEAYWRNLQVSDSAKDSF